MRRGHEDLPLDHRHPSPWGSRRPLPVALIALLVAPSASSALQRQTTTLRGEVLDSLTAQPLAGVSITVPGTGATAMTDERGLFAITVEHAGTVVLRIGLGGYRTMEAELAFPADRLLPDADVGTVPLVREATPLEPLSVVGDSARPVAMIAAFYERMERGLGRFITAADIETRQPGALSQMLRGVSSLRLRCRGATHCVAATARPPRTSLSLGQVNPRDTARVRFDDAPADTLGTLCPMPVYLDGSPVPDMNLDVVVPADVEGVEIYTGPGAPLEYRDSDCGVILIWSKRGG